MTLFSLDVWLVVLKLSVVAEQLEAKDSARARHLGSVARYQKVRYTGPYINFVATAVNHGEASRRQAFHVYESPRFSPSPSFEATLRSLLASVRCFLLGGGGGCSFGVVPPEPR